MLVPAAPETRQRRQQPAERVAEVVGEGDAGGDENPSRGLNGGKSGERGGDVGRGRSATPLLPAEAARRAYNGERGGQLGPEGDGDTERLLGRFMIVRFVQLRHPGNFYTLISKFLNTHPNFDILEDSEN